MSTNCSRCGRILKHPISVNGSSYGSTCVKKMGFKIGEKKNKKMESKNIDVDMEEFF